MATTETTPSLHSPSPDHQPTENKVTDEEPKPIEIETKKVDEEVKTKAEELSSQATDLTKPEGEPEVKHEEPRADEKVDEHAAVNVLVENKTEVEKDPIPDPQTPAVPEQESSAVDNQVVVETVTESVEAGKDLADKVEQEQPKVVDSLAEPSVQSVEEPHEPSESVIPVKESESLVVEKETGDSVVDKVDKPESVGPKVEEKVEEQSDEANKPVEKPETLVSEVELKPEVTKPDDNEPEVPVVGLKPEDETEASKSAEKPEIAVPVAEVKSEDEPGIITPAKELEPVIPEDEKPDDQPGTITTAKELEPVIPEVEKPKDQPGIITPEELSDVVTPAEKPETVIPEGEMKPLDHSDVSEPAEKSETTEAIEKPDEPSESVPTVDEVKSIEDSETVTKEVEKTEEVAASEESRENKQDEKEEIVVPGTGLKREGLTDVINQLEITTEVDRAKDTAKEVETVKSNTAGNDDTEVSAGREKVVVSNNQAEAQAEAGENATTIEEKTVEVATKEVKLENIGEEKQAEPEVVKLKGESAEKEAPKEELAQEPVKVEDDQKTISTPEVVKKSTEVERTAEVSDQPTAEKDNEKTAEVSDQPAAEKAKDESIEEKETINLVETNKDGNVERKTDDAEQVKGEVKDSGLETKEDTKTAEGVAEKEIPEEKVKPDEVETLEAPVKDGDDAKLLQEQPREVPAKPKQSNNILTKVKHSLVKAKKAIIGKSPSSKTLSSETKDDVRVK